MPCANSGTQRPLNSGQQSFVQSSKFREGSHAPPSQFFFVSKSVYLFQRLHPVCLFEVSQSSINRRAKIERVGWFEFENVPTFKNWIK